MKTTTCNKCGATDLVWRKSAKGKWYLSDPQTISTLTHGQFISIPFAHNCVIEVAKPVKSLERLRAEYDNLVAIKNQFPDSWGASDQYALDELAYKIEQLSIA